MLPELDVAPIVLLLLLSPHQDRFLKRLPELDETPFELSIEGKRGNNLARRRALERRRGTIYDITIGRMMRKKKMVLLEQHLPPIPSLSLALIILIENENIQIF